MLDSYIKWLKAHELIILILAGLGTVLFLANKYENYRHDEIVAQTSVAQQALKDQVAKNAELAAQAQTAQSAYAKLAAQVSTQNAALLTQIAALQAKTQEQQKIDQGLTLADLATRWRTLIGSAAPQDIQQVGDNLSVSGQASHSTVDQLEMVDSLHQEVLAGHKIEDNLTAKASSCEAVNKAQTDQIAGLASQITKSDAVCQDQIKLLKNNERRSKLKWAIGSFIGGLLVAAKFAL